MAGEISTRQLTLNQAGNGANAHAPLPKGTKKGTWSLRRGLPSYIPARSFAEALMDLMVPDTAGQTTMSSIAHYISQLPDSMSTMRASLQTLAMNAGDDMTLFRTSLEHWYDDHMDRVSGWYKRHVAWITLVAETVLVLLLNINAITIGRALYSDSAIRTAAGTVAAKGFILVLVGFLLTIVALTPGAQFWFGLLAKLGSRRASGPPPATPAN